MVPFISWGAKLVQYSELTHYHLKQGSEFPNIKSLQCKFWVKCAGHCVDRCALLRLRVDKTKDKQRLSARCAPVWCRTRAPASKSLGKNSGSISPQFLMNLLLCRSAEAGFWTCKWIKSTGKQMKPDWGRNLYLIPSMVANLFALFSSMCEQKVSAYMSSWALLVMTAVW